MPAVAWALAARLSAVAVVGFAALLLLTGSGGGDRWLNAATVAWLDLTLVLAAWAGLARSRTIAIVAALSAVPALVTGITRLHPENLQAYALTIGLYLLGVAAITRWLRGALHREAATAIAALGLLILLGVGVFQSLDTNRFSYALLTLGEGLALVGLGIAIRWRVLVVGGVAGTVVIALPALRRGRGAAGLGDPGGQRHAPAGHGGSTAAGAGTVGGGRAVGGRALVGLGLAPTLTITILAWTVQTILSGHGMVVTAWQPCSENWVAGMGTPATGEFHGTT